MEYGTYPSQTMGADTTIGGYSATITLNSGIKTFYFAIASSIYPGGFPNTVICERLSGKIKIGSSVAVSGLYVSWLVIGTK